MWKFKDSLFLLKMRCVKQMACYRFWGMFPKSDLGVCSVARVLVVIRIIGRWKGNILTLTTLTHIQCRHLFEGVFLDGEICVHREEEAIDCRFLETSVLMLALPIVLVLDDLRTFVLSLASHETAITRCFDHGWVRFEVGSVVPLVGRSLFPVSHVSREN